MMDDAEIDHSVEASVSEGEVLCIRDVKEDGTLVPRRQLPSSSLHKGRFNVERGHGRKAHLFHKQLGASAEAAAYFKGVASGQDTFQPEPSVYFPPLEKDS